MFGLGPTELIVILVLALLVLGPQRIPEAASSLGKAIRSFRRATRELRDQIDIDETVRRPFEDLRSALRDEPAPLPPAVPPVSPVGAEAVPSAALALVQPPADPVYSQAADAGAASPGEPDANPSTSAHAHRAPVAVEGPVLSVSPNMSVPVSPAAESAHQASNPAGKLETAK